MSEITGVWIDELAAFPPTPAAQLREAYAQGLEVSIHPSGFVHTVRAIRTAGAKPNARPGARYEKRANRLARRYGFQNADHMVGFFEVLQARQRAAVLNAAQAQRRLADEPTSA